MEVGKVYQERYIGVIAKVVEEGDCWQHVMAEDVDQKNIFPIYADEYDDWVEVEEK